MPDVRNKRPVVYIRGMSPESKDEFLKAARVRGYSYGKYVSKLVKLHQICRVISDDDHDPMHSRMQTLLETLGLGTVRES